MSASSDEEILEAELARLGGRGSLGGGLGARMTARFLKTSRFEASAEAGAPPDVVASWLVATYEDLGRPLGDGRAVIGAGYRQLNPSVVTAVLVPVDDGRRTRVEVRGVAKEGLVGQRTAAKAVGRVLDAVGAGRERPR